MDKRIADLRQEYSAQNLNESEVAADAVDQFGKWWQQAVSSEIKEPNAMILATASADGLPAARVMLLKGFNTEGFLFFTNYKSYKSMQLEENPKACLVFFWGELEHQVRVVGLVSKAGDAINDEYFQSRPLGSRIGAWASPQSSVVESREWLDTRFDKLTQEYSGKDISRPPHWGGYLVKPVTIEFWQGRPGRLHDRIQYSLQEDGTWKIERLAP
jgi:pyridoxamine 5'-phosphate oxidase